MEVSSRRLPSNVAAHSDSPTTDSSSVVKSRPGVHPPVSLSSVTESVPVSGVWPSLPTPRDTVMP